MIKRILVVDDSPVARKMLIKCIPKDKGYEMLEAVNGQEGIDKFKEYEPEITFMDLTMPVLDGYAAIPEIRKMNATAIIIVMTADIQPKSISKVMGLGAFTLLKKPAKQNAIEDALTKAEQKLNSIPEKTNES